MPPTRKTKIRPYRVVIFSDPPTSSPIVFDSFPSSPSPVTSNDDSEDEFQRRRTNGAWSLSRSCPCCSTFMGGLAVAMLFIISIAIPLAITLTTTDTKTSSTHTIAATTATPTTITSTSTTSESEYTRPMLSEHSHLPDFEIKMIVVVVSIDKIANAHTGLNQIGILGHEVNGTHYRDAAVVVRGASFWGHAQHSISWSHAGLISISDSLFNLWNSTSSSILLERGRAMINNNYFMDHIGNAITISNNVDKVSITNNHFNNNTLDYIAKSTVLVANNLP